MKRTKIKEAVLLEPQNQKVLVQGWVRNKRGSKEVSFVIMNDGSTINTIQVVIGPDFSQDYDQKNGEGSFATLLSKINVGSCISVMGRLIPSEGKGQKSELIPEGIKVFGNSDPNEYPLQPKRHSMEFLRSIGHLRVRTNTFGAVFRVRNAAAFAVHKFYNELGFVYVHTPIITGSDCEGAGEMFQVTTLDLKKTPLNEEGNVDFSKDFFGKPTHLTVSGQLNGELYAMGLSDIYTFGPTFRAENSNTTRHLAEFWMIEPEMAFYDNDDNQDLAEKFLKYVINYVMEQCPDDLHFFNKFISKGLTQRLNQVVKNKFKRITYTEAIDILENAPKEFEYPVKWGVDLQSEHERYLVEDHFKKPVILSDYPKDIKAFYMKQNPDGKTVRAMDVLFPGIGEIIGGSQREEDYDQLLKRIREMDLVEKDYWWYLDTRRFGTAPHSGFGLGFERLVLFLTGMSNIRDVIPFPRSSKTAEF